jgi:hypothetical protein
MLSTRIIHSALFNFPFSDSGSPKLDIELKSVDEHENLQGKSYISFRDLG